MNFYKKRISLLLVITKILNLAFRVRNHLYLFNRSEGELKKGIEFVFIMMGENCSKCTKSTAPP